MTRRSKVQISRRTGRSLAAGLLILASAAFARPAAAQIQMRSFYQGYRPTVAAQDTEALKETLELDEPQQALLEANYAGYVQAFGDAAASIQDGLRSLQEAMAATESPSMKESLIGEYNRLREQWADESLQMEVGFFADVKALLGDEQAARWPRFERDRRRRVGLLLAARLMAERVDLVDVLDRLDLPDEVREACEGVVEQYGLEFDAPLSARHALSDRMERLSYDGDGKGGGDDSQMRSLDERLKRLHVELRDINLRFAEAFAAHLPGEHGARFTQEFRRRAWPRYFRADEVAIDAQRVRELAALTDGQEESLGALLAAHALRLEPIHRELVQVDMTRELQRLWPTGGPGVEPAQPGGEAPGGGESLEARTQRLLEARQAQVRSTLAEIRALLTSDQLRALTTGVAIEPEGGREP